MLALKKNKSRKLLTRQTYTSATGIQHVLPFTDQQLARVKEWMQGDIDQIHVEESQLCLNNRNSPTTASNISSEPGSVLARVDARPTPKHPMEGFLPVSLPAVQGNSLSAGAARALSSPTAEVLRGALWVHARLSLSLQAQPPQHPKATETPLLPHLEQSSEL